MSPFYSATMSRIAENTSFNEKKRSEETQTVRAGGAKNFRPAADPLPGDAGRPKFNQLEMVTTHYLYIQTKFGKDRCTQFRVIVVTKPHTHTPHTHSQTGPITIHCAAASAQCKNGFLQCMLLHYYYTVFRMHLQEFIFNKRYYLS